MLTTLSSFLEKELRTSSFAVVPATRGSCVPRYNVFVDESANTATYEVALPGYVKSDIEVRHQDNQLTVSSTKHSKDSSGYVVQMFSQRPFHLSWSVGDSKVSKAHLADGVLKIVLLRNANQEGTLVPIT